MIFVILDFFFFDFEFEIKYENAIFESFAP